MKMTNEQINEINELAKTHYPALAAYAHDQYMGGVKSGLNMCLIGGSLIVLGMFIGTIITETRCRRES